MTSVDLVGHPVTDRFLRAGQRLRRWDAGHRWALDTVVVLLVFLVYGMPDLGPDRHRPDGPANFTEVSLAGALVLQAGLLVPLWWRRRAPLAAFYAVAAMVVGQLAFGILLSADLALLVAIYALVRHGRLASVPWAAPGVLAVIVAVVLHLDKVLRVRDILFVAVTSITAAAALGFAVRLRHAHMAALRERAVRLEAERDQRSRLAVATERTRMAREMHDIVGHSLSVIITLADGGAYAAPAAPERGREALRLIGDTGRRSLAELRRTLGVLREDSDEPDLRPQPGIADLDALCERIRAAGPQVEYRSTGEPESLDLGVQLAAYRIVQEALTNTLKHAGPRTKVWLTVKLDGTRLRLTVRDTGGPDPATAAEPGHGLIGMRERAALYGGTVTAGPDAGGWRVDAELAAAGDAA